MAALQVNSSFQESTAYLVFYILLESTDTKSLNILRCILLRIGDCCRIKHVHQRCKALRPAVVRRSRKHDHRIGPISQKLRKAGTLCLVISTIRHILRLINHDDVPVCVLQMRPVFYISFQSIY